MLLYHKGQIRPSAKCADIRQRFQASKQGLSGNVKCVHVHGHMDQHLAWGQLSLPQQLKCIGNTQAKRVVMTAIMSTDSTIHHQHNNPQTSPPWRSRLPLLPCEIDGSAQSDAGNFIQRGWTRALWLGLLLILKITTKLI